MKTYRELLEFFKNRLETIDELKDVRIAMTETISEIESEKLPIAAVHSEGFDVETFHQSPGKEYNCKQPIVVVIFAGAGDNPEGNDLNKRIFELIRKAYDAVNNIEAIIEANFRNIISWELTNFNYGFTQEKGLIAAGTLTFHVEWLEHEFKEYVSEELKDLKLNVTEKN